MNIRFVNSPTPVEGPWWQPTAKDDPPPVSPLAPQPSSAQALPGDQSSFQALASGATNSKHSLSSGIADLRQSLEYTLRQQQPPVSAAVQSQLEDSLSQLDLLLQSRPQLSTPADRAALRQQLQNLNQQLRNHNLLTPQLQAQLSQLAVSAIETIAKGTGLPMQVARQGNRPLGLTAPAGLVPLGPQQAAMQDAQALFNLAYNVNLPPGPLNAEKLLVLGLRDQLLRLMSERMLPPPAEVQLAPTQYEDQILLLNGVQMMDEMLRSQEIPPALLQDMTSLVEEMRKQGGNGLKQAFEALGDSGSALQDLAAQTQDVSGQLQDLGSQIQSGSGNLKDLAKALSDAGKGMPNLPKAFGDVIKQYASASNAATKGLPKLPFPITMPVPLTLGSPPNMLSIPAGSSLSYNPATKNYNLGVSGLTLMAGSTAIQAGSGNILLGPTMDRLNVSSLNISDGSTHIQSTGNVIQIDKVHNSSLMQAQNVVVDWSSGHVQMDQVSIVQDPNQVMINANNFAYSDANTQLSATGVQLGQQIKDGVTTTGFSGQNLDLTTNGTQIKAGQLDFNMYQNANDGSSGLLFNGKDVHITSDGNQIDMGQGLLNIQNKADGSTLTTLATKDASWSQGAQQITSSATAFQLQQGPDGQLQSLSAYAADLNYTDGKQNIGITNGTLNATFGPNNQLSQVTAQAGQASWMQGNQALNATGLHAQINYGENGLPSNLNAGAEALNWTDGQQSVNASQLNAQAIYGPDGQLQQLAGSAGQVDWAQGAQNLNASGVNAQLNYGENGLPSNLTAGASQITYSDGKGLLNASNGQLNVNYDETGAFKDATVSGSSLSYASTGGNGKPLNVNLGQFSGQLTGNEQGGQTLNFTGQDLNVVADKTTANIPLIQNLQINTGADGAIDSFHVDLPSTNTVQTQDLSAALKNVQVDYQEKVLSASVEQISGTLTQPELTGTFNLNGVNLIDTEKYTSLHLDSSQIDLSKLQEQYKLDIQNVDLVLDKNALGQLSGGQLRFEDLQAQLKGYTITGTNDAGKQMVMSFGLSEDGKWVEKLGFEIPKGGALSVNKGEDWFLKLGGDQKFGLNYDPSKQIYNFTAENLNLQYINSDMQVDVSGLRGNKANLDISLTPDKGLVINDISNLSGKITLKNMKGLDPVTIDIDKIKGFYLKQTGISGGQQGMMLHLAPTGEDSTMTASIRSSYNGIPVGLSLKNVHELKVGGTIATNQARVYIGDPSGRGQIEIQAGPLKIKGSEIDIEAKYHMYDPQRMLNALDKLNSDNNINILGRALSVDPIKGKVTLDTSNRVGPYLQSNLLFPSPVASALRSMNAPFAGFNGIRDEGFGLTFGTGWRWRGNESENQLGLDFGLLPGSYLSIDQHKGQMSLAGVPLPKHMTLGTTPFAGVNFRQQSEEHTLGVQAGVFANPAAFAPTDQAFIYEDPNRKLGAYAGVKYQHSSGTVIGLEYLGTGNQPGQFFNAPSATDRIKGWDHSAKLSVGFTW